ncbi:unnamed protein product [Calicophoron daubneyi]|uniref:CWH43-like N-terminal domain-containing protein n=1 Tax=Calicophoron daubneyi TaxID=300641 RepID=A0AAV2T6S8_CALDB
MKATDSSLCLTSIFTVVACALPPAALIYCVLLSISKGTCLATHCTDANFLPSLSAAVSDEDPQRSVWSTAVLFSSACRLYVLPFVTASYMQTFSRFLKSDYSHVILLNSAFGFAEIISLNAMSMFSSTYRYEAHRDCLTVFVFCSVMYMAFDVSLLSRLRIRLHGKDLKSNVEAKKRIFAVYVLLLAVVGLCYYVHITYCPAYVYSLFSFFEYIAIFVNVAYHYKTFSPFRQVPVRVFAEYPVRGKLFFR